MSTMKRFVIFKKIAVSPIKNLFSYFECKANATSQRLKCHTSSVQMNGICTAEAWHLSCRNVAFALPECSICLAGVWHLPCYSRTELVCEKIRSNLLLLLRGGGVPVGGGGSDTHCTIFITLCSLPPRPLGTPPPRRRGIKILSLFAFLFANQFCSTIKCGVCLAEVWRLSCRSVAFPC